MTRTVPATRVSGVGLILALLVVLLFVAAVMFPEATLLRISPWVWGFLPLVLAVGVVWTTGRFNPLAPAVGDDNRLSLSKFQTLLWTFVVLYVYVVFAMNNLQRVSGHPGLAGAFGTGTTPGTIGFPPSVLLLLGFSITTLVGAAGITANQVANGSIKKPACDTPSLDPRWLVLGDDGNVDLTRFQVLLWTFVAAGVFLGDAWYLIGNAAIVTSLPDIGNTLVLLMGVGQAAYIGGKLVVTPGKPIVYRLVPSAAHPGDTVQIIGSGFGNGSQTSFAVVNGQALVAAPAAWSDTVVTFTVPAADPRTGRAWAPGAVAGAAIAVGPLESDPEPLTLLP